MTPTREQLIEDIAGKLWRDLCEGEGQHSEALDKSLIRKHMDRLAACLAAPPTEPQAMPPIEVGDVVTQMGHGRPVAVLVEDVDDHLLTVRHLAHSETIHYKHALAIYKPVWTREPRR